MRQPPGAGGAFLSALAASLVVNPYPVVCRQPEHSYTNLLRFPFLVAGRQHEQLYDRRSPREPDLADQQTAAGLSGLPLQPRTETTKYKKLKDTATNQQGASAVAANPPALAGENPAVRAIQPVRGSGKYAGLSTPLQARSLQDWEVEDFVLLATVDGSIHARDRKTGAAKWELEVDRPMVETIYHTQNQSDLTGYKPEYDFLWIVEPSRDGDIYIYNQGGLGGLQKMHLSVKQLVADMSPYESVDPAVVYNGEKRTKLYTVDATTGTINKVFGSGGALSKEPRCPKPGGLDVLDDEECGSSGSFVLGRTEYTITIQNRDTTEPMCTLKYSEWGPNTRDGDLHSQYSATMDNKYVYPLHDGSIFGWDYGQMVDRQRSYTQKLSSPVVRVFDVARPLHTDEQDPQLIVLPQPVGPIETGEVYDSFNPKNRIFVNHTEAGGWFAMSENTYPLVTGKAKAAQCYDEDWVEMTSTRKYLSLAQRQEGFVGVHSLSEFETRQASGLTISGHPDTSPANDSPVEVYDEPSRLPSLPHLGKSKILGSAFENAYDIFIVCFLLILAYCFLDRRKIFKMLNQNVQLRNPIIIADPPTASVPSSPVVAITPSSVEKQPNDQENHIEKPTIIVEEDVTPIKPRRSSTLLGPPPDRARSRSNSLEERGRTDDERGVRFRDPSNARTEDGEQDAPNSPQPGKKKARRGMRGGTKHSKKKRSNSEHATKDDVDQTVKEIMELAKDGPKETQIQPETAKSLTTTGDVTDVTGPLQIGHLKVNLETVLGYGGHGTMVYKGSFGGRDVAVKRMLRDFYDIASHEVGLLQESDDHPNVIRYYDKEEDSQFFYIALELCPASLQDVVERPQDFPSLINSSLDKPEMLRQITSGLLYLHSLKIVHRDIKPQNILVSAPKANPALPTSPQQPRLLISDFGLCKKLEADQNSFRATTAHAAGTSGWRAPELLNDDDSLRPSASITDTNNSEPLVVDSQTKRSATRAIDIFSLGCIFYYCLTGGWHPYDGSGRLMREHNITKSNYDISKLDCLGDYRWEARDLVKSMLTHNPKDRPDAAAILRHPFFWPPEKRLDFLCQVSDGFEHPKHEYEKKIKENPATPIPFPKELTRLESYAPRILKEARGDFLRALPYDFVQTLGKQRTYTPGSVVDLLRALRNKKNHYQDIPEEVRRRLGGLPEGYLTFWTRRFPKLLLCVWRCVAELGWEGRDEFGRFYRG